LGAPGVNRMNDNAARTVTAAALVIGDEILSGRTKDRNIGTIADFCTELGIELKQARIVSDEMDAIVAAVKEMSQAHTYLFTTGGIGPTHDDITADAVAAAFDVELPVNDEARRILEERYGTTDVSPERLRMARIPVGATLIGNTVSGAPGFTIENVHVMAGVPKIMEAMLADLAGRLEGGRKVVSRAIDCGVGESTVAAGLNEIQQAYPDLRLGSYPQIGRLPVYTQLVVRGTDPDRVAEAADRVRLLVDELHKRKNVILTKDEVK